MKNSRSTAAAIHKAPTSAGIRAFRRLVWAHYRRHKRDLPWRGIRDPYRVLVSEMMLQQTQVDRVIPKYRAFIRTFPTVRSLARAPLRDVLLLWQGLGYNRRARMLHECAKIIVEEHGDKIPRKKKALVVLPGVGSYTAAAVRAFAYHEPEALIETNIRTVFIHHFFPERERVSDRELMPFIEACLDRKRPSEWNHALMDCGSMLKRTHGNASRRSAHYAKQSRFEGSARQLRGAIVRLLLSEHRLSSRAIARHTKRTHDEAVEQLERLTKEGVILKRGATFTLV